MDNEEIGKPEADNNANKLIKRLQENSIGIHISRVPEKTKQKFINLANSEFCGDYGFCLKWLMDDLLSQDTKMIISSLQDHEGRLVKLESLTTKEIPVEPKGIKLLNGKKLGDKK